MNAKNRFVLAFLAIVLVIGTISGALASSDVEDALREGETQWYEINGEKVEVTAVYVTDPTQNTKTEAKLMVNGEVVSGYDDSESRAGCYRVEFKDVVASDREGLVKFGLAYACDNSMAVPGSDDTEHDDTETDATSEGAYVESTASGSIDADTTMPYPYDDDWFEGKLREGSTAVYHHNGMEYELTLLWVSNPYLEGETGTEYTNDVVKTNDPSTGVAYHVGDEEQYPRRSLAKFSLNGEVSDSLSVGEYDKLECGVVKVEQIYNGLSTSTQEDVSVVAYKFKPYECGEEPPTSNDYLRLREGETKTITVDNRKYKITALAIEQDEWKTSAAEYADAVVPRWTAKLSVNGEGNYIEEHMWERFGRLRFYVDDIDLDDKYIILTKFQHTSFTTPPRACTEELKSCPDGGYTSRDPNNNCEFAPCRTQATEPEDCESGRWVCPSDEYGTEPNCYCLTNEPDPDPAPVDCDENNYVCTDSGQCYCFGPNPSPDPVDPTNPSVTSCESGCLVEDRCIPIGTRLANGEARYCDLMGEFQNQVVDGSSCQNNYECASNQCLNAVCQSLDKEIHETKGLLTRFLGWLEGWFGK